MFIIWITDSFQMLFLFRSDLRISLQKDISKLSELNIFQIKNRLYLQHYLSDKCFKGAIVNLELPLCSLKLRLRSL